MSGTTPWKYLIRTISYFGDVPPKASQCSSCGKHFESKKALRQHIDREHRITDETLKRSRTYV